uniref:Anion exchange protein n=1 Tax=Steinernema glaseri TaxID=37863 RepID=A0A1I8ATI9_9BILA
MLVVMVAVRKLMEKAFSEKDLKYLDDKMPDFHLRKREDLKRKQSETKEEIEIDLDENQGTIHAVKTEAHLHIPMASGNVIKIPLAAIQDKPSHNINISKEVASSGMWKHITAVESRSSLQGLQGSRNNPLPGLSPKNPALTFPLQRRRRGGEPGDSRGRRRGHHDQSDKTLARRLPPAPERAPAGDPAPPEHGHARVIPLS